MVVRLMDGAISSSTTFSASSRSVQPLRPSGGSPSRNAMTWASCRPSSDFARGGVSRCLPFKAMSKPSVTRRLRTFSTVCLLHRNASAMSWSFQFRPSASALSKMLARRTFSEEPLSFLMMA